MLILLVLYCGACTTTNPSFDLSRSDAKHALSAMMDEPKPGARPVVVLGGYLDPGLLTELLAEALGDTLVDTQVITVSFGATRDFDACRARLFRALEAALPDAMGPSGSPTTEPIDVVAISMGGLVARYAALDHPDHVKRLNIKRLFTISSPHQGATWAYLPTLNSKTAQMRPGSDWLGQLNRPTNAGPDEMYCYVRLRDSIVGPSRAAPPGQTAWWVYTPLWQSPHLGAPTDPRIVADVARRLRGEPGYTQDPPTPLP